jgi:hypothetical protein
MRVFFRLFAALLGLGFSFCAWGQHWRYVDQIDQLNDIVIQRGPNQSSMGHVGFDAGFCDAKEPFFCFHVGTIKFAVPKDSKAFTNKKSWAFDGHEYVISGTKSMNILGQQIQVFYVDSATQSIKLRFYYSAERGLIAIRGLGTEFNRLLILEERCGFAAPASCGG